MTDDYWARVNANLAESQRLVDEAQRLLDEARATMWISAAYLVLMLLIAGTIVLLVSR